MKITIIDYLVDETVDQTELSFVGSVDSTNFREFEKRFSDDMKNVANLSLECENLDFVCDAAVGLIANHVERIARAGGIVRIHNAKTPLKEALEAAVKRAS